MRSRTTHIEPTPDQPAAAPAGATGDRETRARNGSDDHRRVAGLFESHNKALLRFLTCRLRSAHEAREIAQEAYVRLLQLDEPGSVGYLRAYLFKTAANLAADRMKSAARRSRADQLRFFDELDTASPSPEGGVSAEQELRSILSMIEELPPRCRHAFIMHRFYGYSIAEIATSMQLSPRMIQLYVERALAFCRDGLQQDPKDRP